MEVDVLSGLYDHLVWTTTYSCLLVQRDKTGHEMLEKQMRCKGNKDTCMETQFCRILVFRQANGKPQKLSV